MNIELREFRASDREACMSVFQSNVPRYFREHELSDYLEYLDSSDLHYFIVVAEKKIVGCGGFGGSPGSLTADLCWGMVHSSHHRKGIGAFLLLTRLYKIINNTNFQQIRLGTSQLTDGFYRRYGFLIQSRIRNGIDNGLDDIEMLIELTDQVRESIELALT